MMLKYPDNFNTPTFPAGPRIALSRVMGIGIMILFALIIAVGGMIFWASHSQQVHPFLVSIDNITGAWSVVGHDHGERTISTNRAMQESVVALFTRDWLTVSADADQNDGRWAALADKTECASGIHLTRTFLYCAGGTDLYKRFIQNIVPTYQQMAIDGHTMTVSVDDIYVQPTPDVTDNGGTWRVIADVRSGLYGTIRVMAYVVLRREPGLYPNTLGFYVWDFNAYNIGNE